MLDKLKTLTGIPASKISERLAKPFDDPAAYKEIKGGVGGAAGLTDIDTAWMVERATEVFGPYGLGWKLDWDVDDVVINGDPKRPTVALKRAEFRYILLDKEGKEQICIVPCTGGSTNELPYALKGMETSAIGNALSKMRFQEPVYKGKLSHKNAKAFLESKNGGNGRKPTASLAKGNGKLKSDFVVPIGKNKGKKLSDLSPRSLKWYAKEMKPTTDAAKKLQQEAKSYIDQLAVAA